MMESHREIEEEKSPRQIREDRNKAVKEAEERKKARKLINKYYIK